MIRYLLRRFPPHTVGLATVLTFLSIQSLYVRAAPDHRIDWPALAAATLTFVLLFVQLRLVDDIDDFRRDTAADPSAGGVGRGGLVAALAATVAATALLMARNPAALLVALAATATMLFAPVVAKHPGLPGYRLLLPLVYEGAPALVMAFGYAGWRGYGGSAASPRLVLGITGLFWAAYEFWKFSRKLDRDDYRPYGLGRPGRCVTLAVLLAVAAGCVALAYSSRALPPMVLGYGLLVPLVFACWLLAWWLGATRPGAGAPGRAGAAWAGLTFVFVLEFGLLALAGWS